MGHRSLPSPPQAPRGQTVEVSTRKLILTSLLCGLAILLAFTVQVLLGRF